MTARLRTIAVALEVHGARAHQLAGGFVPNQHVLRQPSLVCHLTIARFKTINTGWIHTQARLDLQQQHSINNKPSFGHG